ncbi:MAG: hypothetical protein U1F71_12015 [Verrucomicrobiaceae bacterium]
MKNFVRKLGLSFTAMLHGWLVCNVILWLVPVSNPDALTRLEELFGAIVFLIISTAIVVSAAWLIVFLPVDLLVPEDSKLRRPKTAATCGFLAAFAIVLIVFMAAAWHPVQQDGLWEGLRTTADLKALPYVLATSAIGAVAAFSRSRMGKSASRTTP